MPRLLLLLALAWVARRLPPGLRAPLDRWSQRVARQRLRRRRAAVRARLQLHPGR